MTKERKDRTSTVTQHAADSVFVAKSQKGYLARKALFDAAIPLIAMHGIHGFSIGVLCEQAGLKRTSFYTYFQTMADFLDELSAHEDINYNQTLMDEVGEIPDGIRKLAYHILKFYWVAREDNTWSRYAIEMLSSHELTVMTLSGVIVELLHAAVDAGEITLAEDDMESFAHLVLATLAAVRWQKHTDKLPKDAGQRVLTFLLRAIQTRPQLIKSILTKAPRV